MDVMREPSCARACYIEHSFERGRSGTRHFSLHGNESQTSRFDKAQLQDLKTLVRIKKVCRDDTLGLPTLSTTFADGTQASQAAGHYADARSSFTRLVKGARNSSIRTGYKAGSALMSCLHDAEGWYDAMLTADYSDDAVQQCTAAWSLAQASVDSEQASSLKDAVDRIVRRLSQPEESTLAGWRPLELKQVSEGRETLEAMESQRAPYRDGLWHVHIVRDASPGRQTSGRSG